LPPKDYSGISQDFEFGINNANPKIDISNNLNLRKVLIVPYSEGQICNAIRSLSYFRSRAISPYHERFSFPFFSGTFFVYRKIDVKRIVTISKTVSQDPSYLDVGCGYGEFLTRIREHIPDALGMEVDPRIFYYIGKYVPSYIKIWDPKWGLDHDFDIIFVGWMEPGTDFRDEISKHTKVIVTTLDQGLSLAAEYEGHGFELVAWWRSPSWEDVNIEIMNRYYTRISKKGLEKLSNLRGAHNLWYVYSRDKATSEKIRANLVLTSNDERPELNEKFDYEEVLDECGFGFHQELSTSFNGLREKLWEIRYR
jgi:SAM-dependent methyltransferase